MAIATLFTALLVCMFLGIGVFQGSCHSLLKY